MCRPQDCSVATDRWVRAVCADINDVIHMLYSLYYIIVNIIVNAGSFLHDNQLLDHVECSSYTHVSTLVLCYDIQHELVK